MDSFLQRECDLQYFHDNRFIRKRCSSCGDYFWTLDSDAQLCDDRPCVDFSFINNPLGKKSFSLKEVRESFLSFFEQNGHSRLRYPETGERCPVVARWRSDIYLTIASIADFQPHVTSGEIPPPANPLVISQPCIRLNDLEKVGRSGSHLTMFEMMGHHAFNKHEDEIYWKEKTVAYCDEFFVNRIGIPRELINYKEQLWDGGGNAGPCLEVIAGGLEIATLVFMNMKEDENGKFTINGKKYTQNPLNIVDTGYGLERIAWCSQGTKTVYETVFPEVIDWLKDNAKNTSDMASIYSLADHSKCLAFMLGDGIVPSNVKAGYLARLIIRRALRFIEKLRLNVPLREIVGMQLEMLEREFPSLKKRETQVNETLDIETKKFSDTLSKGKNLIKRILKDKESIDNNALINLYDTHGMPPDVVKKIAKNEGTNVTIPENFDSMIAELHSHEKKDEGEEEIRSNLPSTESLYYKDHYIREFDAEVLWKNKTGAGTEVVLDKTVFYPEGGGQPSDIGYFSKDRKKYHVKHVKKEGDAIIHVIDGNLNVGEKVHGVVDWDHRYTLMKHHTGTHLVNGALRHVLGEHIWQAGSRLGINDARFDFAHYKLISEKEEKDIEKKANDYIKQAVKIEKKIMDRNSAEQKYGFRLYQGGVPPGNSIRVLNIPGIDVEACGGMHLNNTSEVEKIKIINFERIQDGVNRIIFAAGKMADDYLIKENRDLENSNKIIKAIYDINNLNNASEQLMKASKIFSVQRNQFLKTLERFKEFEYKRINNQYLQIQKIFDEHIKIYEQLHKAMQPSKELQEAIKKSTEQYKQLHKAMQPSKELQEAIKKSTELYKITTNFYSHIYNERTKKDLVEACNKLFNEWKKTRKMTKQKSADFKISGELYEEVPIKIENKTIKIRFEDIPKSLDPISRAGKIIEEGGYVAYVSSGNKVTIAASEDVDIDLRPVAIELGKLLGGSGGGKPKMAHCGGKKSANAPKIVKKSEELIKNQLTKKKHEKK